MPTDELRRLAGRVLVGGFDGTAAPEDLLQEARDGLLAGVILFRRNLGSLADVYHLCASLHASAPEALPLLVSVDQEGGRVARLGAPLTTLPPMRALGARGDPAFTREAARVLGEELAALGFTLDFAPVCDVDSNPENPIIGDRSFGRDAATVATHATAFFEGLEAAGVASCAKHFPGHGDTETDSHLELPRVRHTLGRLDTVELPPFRALVRAGVPSVMSAHVVYDALCPEEPATVSLTVMTRLLRGQMHFQGVAFSDDLHMRAVADRFSLEECAERSLAAGCDALLVCTDRPAQARVRAHLAALAGAREDFRARLEEAAGRVDALRRRYPPRAAPTLGDLDALWEDPARRRLREALKRAWSPSPG
ncbi:MAG: beta-N-acetylhexosaminidase [Deltaproteobacteria bacterium]|nr:beta-N-acetylhexosaminidase [Deltaproteobacteria bacterium]